MLTEAWNFTPEPDAVWQTVELTVDFKTGVMTATVNGVVASFNTSDPWPSTAWRDGVFCALAPKSDSPDGYDDRKDIHSMYILEGPSVGRYPFAEACTGVDLPYAGCDPAATAATSGKPTYTALDKPISETGPTCENVGLVTVSDEKECQAAAVANGKLFELMRIDEYQESIRPFGCHANTYESRVDVVVNNVSRTWFFNRQNDSTVVNEDIARLVCKSSVASKAASSSDNRVLLSEFEEHPFFGTICSVSGKVKSNSLKKKRTGACITDADCPCTAVCVRQYTCPPPHHPPTHPTCLRVCMCMCARARKRWDATCTCATPHDNCALSGSIVVLIIAHVYQGHCCPSAGSLPARLSYSNATRPTFHLLHTLTL